MKTPPPGGKKPAVRTSHIAIAELISTLLVIEQVSIAELAESSGLHKLTVGFLMRTFRTKKVVHISGYDYDTRGRANTPLWSLGNKKDAPRPPKADRNAVRRRQREWRARNRLAEHLNLLAAPVASAASAIEPLTETEHETI